MNKNNTQNKKLQSALVISLSTLSALIALLTPDWKQKLLADYYPNPTTSAGNLGSVSTSTSNSQLIFGMMDAKVQSHKEKQDQINITKPAPAISSEQKPMPEPPAKNINFTLTDLKYEQVKFANTGTKGNIKSLMLAFSTELSNAVELGVYVPYDYMDFNTFTAHRTGAIFYAKHNQQLADISENLQLSTMINMSGVATYFTDSRLSGTLGAGFGASLSYDNGGDFVPRALFSFQYAKDYLPDAAGHAPDTDQYLVKMGASLGYRLFENGTLYSGFSYTRDVTPYKLLSNEAKDHDYVDLSIGGSYLIASAWQVSLSYKRVLGLQDYTSNAVFLGTSLGF